MWLVILTKGKYGRFAKTIFILLRANHGHYCRVEGKRVNLGDGQGLQIPCTLHFTGETKYIEVLDIQGDKKYIFLC